MSLLLNFINNHKRELVQIYTKERQTSGCDGVLWIIETPDKQANVSYVQHEDLPVPLLEELKKKKEETPSDSIIYFYVCDPLMAQLIEIDLRNFNPENSVMTTVVEETKPSEKSTTETTETN